MFQTMRCINCTNTLQLKSKLDRDAALKHIHECLQNQPLNATFLQTSSFTCYFCDRNLGTAKPHERFRHVWKCAETVNDGLSYLSQLIAPSATLSTNEQIVSAVTNSIQPPTIPTSSVSNAIDLTSEDSDAHDEVEIIESIIMPSESITRFSAPPMQNTEIIKVFYRDATALLMSASRNYSNHAPGTSSESRGSTQYSKFNRFAKKKTKPEQSPSSSVSWGSRDPIEREAGLQSLINEPHSFERAYVDEDISAAECNNSSPSATPSSGSLQFQQQQATNHVILKSLSSSSATTTRDISMTPMRWKNAPKFKQIKLGSMTEPIIVDGFQYACKELSSVYFLTHFHSDHYTGLSSSFRHGKIYCSQTTAALCQLRLFLDPSVIVPLSLDVEHIVEMSDGHKVKVVLADANHCPGAVVIIFRLPGSVDVVLHTGDFRYNPSMLQRSPLLEQLAISPSNPKNLTIYLDTTYCDPSHCFPSQAVAIDAVVRQVELELAQKGATRANRLFVFGAYGIGKERVFMAVARKLAVKVYVDENRKSAMMCFDDWDVTDLNMLTNDPTETCVWVKDLGQISFKTFQSIRKEVLTIALKKRKRSLIPTIVNVLSLSSEPPLKVIGFVPTGWTFRSDDIESNSTKKQKIETASIMSAKYKDDDTIYSVPYSEHSSFIELIDCIRTFRPHRVIPTVNTSPERVVEQLDLLQRGCHCMTSSIDYSTSAEVIGSMKSGPGN